MQRYYIFTWHKNEKGAINRTNKIVLSKPTGYTEYDAKRALTLFTSTFGSLKYNTIISIKEYDENGQIGEDIVPASEGTSIIPERR